MRKQNKTSKHLKGYKAYSLATKRGFWGANPGSECHSEVFVWVFLEVA